MWINVDDEGRVPAFVRSNGLVVGNLFVSDVLESSPAIEWTKQQPEMAQ
jgi:hypothetical protein